MPVSRLVARLESTHDAVFVFEKDRLVGLVNLYHSFLGKKFNPSEKSASCLYHAPILTPETSLLEVARLMVESRVYQLPVLQKEQLLGVVFAADVLGWAKGLLSFKLAVGKAIKVKPAVFVSENEALSRAIHLMIKGRTNRLLVVGKAGNLQGVLTLYDLRRFFSQPKTRISFLARAPIKKEFTCQPVKRFYRHAVIGIDKKSSLAAAVSLMVREDVGSLVVFPDSRASSPLGLVTLRDFLWFIAGLGKNGNRVFLGHKFRKKRLKLARQVVFNKFQRLFSNNPLFAHRVESIQLSLKNVAKGDTEARLPLLEITARVRLSSGNRLIMVKAKGRRLTVMTDRLIGKTKRLLRQKRG